MATPKSLTHLQHGPVPTIDGIDTMKQQTFRMAADQGEGFEQHPCVPLPVDRWWWPMEPGSVDSTPASLLAKSWLRGGLLTLLDSNGCD
jgi:hypothetical protein